MGASNGDDSVLRTFQRLIDLDGGSTLVADQFDPLASLTNDRAGQLSVAYPRREWEGWGRKKKQACGETL